VPIVGNTLLMADFGNILEMVDGCKSSAEKPRACSTLS
jgi:hypothetical protein